MFVYEDVMRVCAQIASGMQGRAADSGVSLPWVANMAVQAGAGDHLEIGTLFGASAIAVAASKKAMGVSGSVYCLDNFGKREGIIFEEPAKGKELGSPEEVMENAKKFGVEDRIKIVVASSQPWPEELEDKRFATAFIDGDHTGGTPWFDFQECAKRTEYYIGFDNYEEAYPDVQSAVHRALSAKDGDWTMLFKNNIFAALRRRNVGRNATVALMDLRTL